MKMRTKILLSTVVLVLIALITVVSANFYIFRDSMRNLNETPKVKPPEEVVEMFILTDKEFEKYDLRIIPIPREFENEEDIFTRSVELSKGGFLLTLVIISATCLVFTYFASKKITVPLSELSKAAKKIGEGDLTSEINYVSNDEFGEVCQAFNQMRQRLLEEQEKTRKLEQARTEMIADISHDLKTPLTSVKGYIKGIQDGIANTDEKRQRYLETAYKRASDMDILLERLFYVSKVESGTLPVQKEFIDFAKVIEDYVFIATPELSTINAEIYTEISEKPCMLHLDYGQIQRVLSNFIENSVKYSNAENLKIKIELSHDANFATLIYSDNGIGVSDEQLPFLFERFWRGDKTRNEKEGSGLGLYICEYIINSHGGTIEASNQDGLKFTIKLPRKD